ncbi:hypothetical protein MHI57_24670 [Cytobacillus sp. FSL K6-0129]|uniref:hypothetical protein n=1 Tax=Cytobacillus sp. FSL K6-0129 TaxID=2921421 RepID=UPI0030FAB6C6
MTNLHYIADESIGGIEREYVEVERKADVGDYVLGKKGHIRKVTDYFINGEVFVESIETGNDCGTYSHDFYVVLEPTDIVRIDDERFRLADRHAEVGEKVIIVYHDPLELSVGSIHTVSEIITDGYRLGGDFIDVRYDDYRVLEPVEADPLTVDETQASPEVIDMLANLARRVTQLEEQLSDTQRNVETFAEQTETNSEDIRLLGERDVTIVIKRGDRQ